MKIWTARFAIWKKKETVNIIEEAERPDFNGVSSSVLKNKTKQVQKIAEKNPTSIFLSAVLFSLESSPE